MSKPNPLVTLPTQPEGVAWPLATWPVGEPLGGENGERLLALLDQAFSDTAKLGETHAFLAIQGGKVIYERYGDGYTGEQTYPSWSMAKSMTHALAGIAISQGAVALDDRIDAPEWQTAGDPRQEITLAHMLAMSSGLRFTEDYEDSGISHTIEMLFGSGKPDTANFAAALPLDHTPGSAWSYSSGTTNIICRFLATALKLDQAGFAQYMWTSLFDPIAIRSAIPKFDAAGTFIGSSFCFCTPRDFARFGLLYLRDGVWNGHRILPPGWVDHARTPTPHVPDDEPMGYGGHWWLDIAGPGSFSANGYEGQYIVLVPETDLILVRHGASEAQKDAVRAWLADVAACFTPI